MRSWVNAWSCGMLDNILLNSRMIDINLTVPWCIRMSAELDRYPIAPILALKTGRGEIFDH